MSLIQKQVSYQPNTKAVEDLPFPIALYPGFYGAFFSFKKDEESKPYFCSCSYEAIENYINIRKMNIIPLNSSKDKMFIIDSSNFPFSVVEELMNRKDIDKNEIIKYLNFADKLCHECNLKTPFYRYCHEMYGGAFKQNYGWYICKQYYEWGIDKHNWKACYKNLCPENLLPLLEDIEFNETRKRINFLNEKIREIEQVSFSDNKDIDKKTHDINMENISLYIRERIELNKKNSKHIRKINNFIENEVRRKFGHKNIGEAWTSETILYYIVKKLFPQYTIIRHYRPKILEGLEFDIYIEDINIGIEYQGIQHYKPIKHWGGKESLIELKKRDTKKKMICEKNHIPLIYFEYNEGLNDQLVLNKLSNVLN